MPQTINQPHFKLIRRLKRVSLTLFFCLFVGVTFAATPQVGTITPSSGISNPDQAVSFTTTYSDPDGWQNIRFVYLLINTSTNRTNCFYGYYNQNTNKLYLRNDNNTAWLGGFTSGSANTIENSYAKLDCALTTISGSSTTLTINWSVTFKPSFTGAKNIYLNLKDDQEMYQDWTEEGTWTINNRHITFAPTYSEQTTSVDATTTSDVSNTVAVETFAVATTYSETAQTSTIEAITSSSGTSYSEERIPFPKTHIEPKEETETFVEKIEPAEVKTVDALTSGQQTTSDSISPSDEKEEPTLPTNDAVTTGPDDILAASSGDSSALAEPSTAPDEDLATQDVLISEPTVASVELIPASNVLPSNQIAQSISELILSRRESSLTDNAQFISQVVPTTMMPGQSYTVQLTFKNTGTSTWSKATNYKLGSQNPQDNLNWGVGRILLADTSSVIPGQSVTFSFTVKAPSVPGTYNFQWRMLKEGVAWFGDYSTNVNIQVNKTNASPSVGTFSPSSITLNPSNALVFTSTYSDPDGYADIKTALLLINTKVDAANGFYAYYDSTTNKLYLVDDTGTQWLGGYTPGSNNSIENSSAKLDCTWTSVLGKGNTLTISWSITFKYAFSGSFKEKKNVYLKVIDKSNALQDWTQVDTLTLTNPGSWGESISPSTGTSSPNTSVNFTSTYGDLNGYADIQEVQLVFHTKDLHLKTTLPVDTKNSLWLIYNQNTNQLSLIDDTGTTWLGGLGYTPGANKTLENSYVKLDCAKTTVTGSGNTLTVTWAVTFKDTFTGAKTIYLYAKDDANGYQGWTPKGTWTITAPDNSQFISQVVPTTMTAGSTYSVSVTMKNTGTTTWTKATNYKLGAQNPQDNTTWGLGRVLLSDTDSIAPNSSKTFTFTVTAPKTAGTYNFQWRMLKEGVAWFGDYSQNVSVTVDSTDTTPPQITNTTPLDGSTFYEADTVLISPTVNDVDSSPLEYQFSIDGIIKQAWSSVTSYTWTATSGIHNIKVEVKDTGGQDTKQVEIYVFIKPIAPP